MLLMVKAMQLKVGNPLRKLILLKLADNASDSGECWPSYRHIADQCEVGRRTAMRHINQLEADGFLKVVKRRKSATENYTNVYVLTLEKGEEKGGGGGVTESPPSVTESLGGGVTESLGGVTESLGGGVTESPRTSHSFEPVNEPIRKSKQKENLKKVSRPKLKPPKSSKPVLDFSGLPISEDLARELADYRKAIKKNPLTPRALKAISKKIVDVALAFGLSHEEVVTIIQEKGWASVEVGWVGRLKQESVYGNRGGNAGGQHQESSSQRAKRINAEYNARVMSDPNRTRSTDDHF